MRLVKASGAISGGGDTYYDIDIAHTIDIVSSSGDWAVRVASTGPTFYFAPFSTSQEATDARDKLVAALGTVVFEGVAP